MPTDTQQFKKQMFDSLFGASGSMTKAEFNSAFESIIKQILRFEKKLLDKNTEITVELRLLFSLLKERIEKDSDTELRKVQHDAKAAISKAIDAIDAKLRTIKDGKDGIDGYTPIKGVDYFDGSPGQDGKDGAPDTGEDIIKKVNKDKGEKKINKEKIEYLEYVIDWIKSFNKTHERSMRLYNGGLVGTIIAGSGITVDSTDPGQPIVAATGGISVKTATGTIDDSNTAFTMSATSTLIIVNGAVYRHGSGVTISGTSVTLDSPVGTGGSIFGL